MRQGRYLVHPLHFGKRCRERGMNIEDVKHAIERAQGCAPYVGRDPTAEGTNWRVSGPSIDSGAIAVGVEAHQIGSDQWVLLITLFEV